MIKNYLVDQLLAEERMHTKHIHLLKTQMKMLVYQTLDLITEQYARIKPNIKPERKDPTTPKQQDPRKPHNDFNTSCFLGLLFEANVGEFELDTYAFVSNTKYKYILIKNEQHQIIRNLASIQYQATATGFGPSNTQQQAQIQLL
jgi:hypothetical protein